MSIDNLSIGKKIYVLAIIVIIIFSICITWLVSNLSDTLKQTAEKKLSAAVESSWGIIDHYSKQVGHGMTLEQAQNEAKSLIRDLRYEGNKLYFWINDSQPKMIMHPIKPSLDNTNIGGIKDPDGLALFTEFAKATEHKDSAYVTYQWPKPGSEKPQPKLSYVKKHMGWDWIIGSGIYINDLQAKINSLIYTTIGIVLLAILLSALMVYFIARSIVQPTQKAVVMMQKLEKGHLSERLNLTQQDEIGKMTQSMDAFANSLQNEVVASIQKLANGNLNLNLIPRDAQDEVRGALNKLEADLNDVMFSIQSAGEQISQGSVNVSDSAQALSQGATESAASLEEISSSLDQLSSQTKLNADNANQVNALSSEAEQATEQGKEMMKHMLASMSDINEAGQNINKIIKVIDEIAFQTNLLALNAAVEAARAGQHGKGFAVVAEEVRNLASRSSKAASETAELIIGSVQKAENGTDIANKTANALELIYGGISKVSDLAEEIAASSNDQAEGIGQINQGLGQIDKVIQQNTATAEESAAAAEELSSQAVELQNMLQRFTLKGQAQRAPQSQPQIAVKVSSPRQQPPKSQQNDTWGGQPAKAPQPIIALDDKDFGKF